MKPGGKQARRSEQWPGPKETRRNKEEVQKGFLLVVLYDLMMGHGAGWVGCSALNESMSAHCPSSEGYRSPQPTTNKEQGRFIHDHALTLLLLLRRLPVVLVDPVQVSRSVSQ